MLCTKCGNLKAQRSRRRGAWDWTLSRFGLVPYRCGTCQARFHAVAATGVGNGTTLAGAPESRPSKRRKPQSFGAALKEKFNLRKEKRGRIVAQLVIYGVALTMFLILLYGLTTGRAHGF